MDREVRLELKSHTPTRDPSLLRGPQAGQPEGWKGALGLTAPITSPHKRDKVEVRRRGICVSSRDSPAALGNRWE